MPLCVVLAEHVVLHLCWQQLSPATCHSTAEAISPQAMSCTLTLHHEVLLPLHDCIHPGHLLPL